MAEETYTLCKNCGAAYGLHRTITNQCPKNGREAPVGRQQQWSITVFEEQPQISQAAAKALLDELRNFARWGRTHPRKCTYSRLAQAEAAISLAEKE